MIKRKRLVSIKGLKYRARRELASTLPNRLIEQVNNFDISGGPSILDEEHEEFEQENSIANYRPLNDYQIDSRQYDAVSLSNPLSEIRQLANRNQVKVNYHEDVIKSVGEFIQKWTVEFNIQRSAITVLLHFLNEFFPNLPLDSRTLLGTPRKTNIVPLNPGTYHHLGLESHLIDLIRRYGMIPELLLLAINLDGVPIFSDSVENNFWVILGRVRQLSQCVFPIGLYRGKHKPGDFNELLKYFVAEYLKLKNQFEIDGFEVKLKIDYLALDAPARSETLGVHNHNAYEGCPRCDIEGVWLNNRMCFPGPIGNKRTNESFRNKRDLNYHIRRTILEDIEDLDLVEDIIIDYLHVVLLGIMKKLLTLWFGLKGMFTGTKETISEMLIDLNEWRPMEFGRCFREVKYFKSFHGTELRTFLLKTGPVVLKDKISVECYDNFMKLHAAIRILTDKNLSKSILHVAETLLNDFVFEFGEIYGRHYMSHNVHMLLHICEDVIKYGPLDEFSCFPFENYMTPIKEFVNGNNFVLEQVSKRCEEQLNASQIVSVRKSNEHGNIELIWKKQNLEIKYKGLKFDSSQKNRFMLTIDKRIVVISKIFEQDGKVTVEGNVILNKEPMYQFPVNSENFGIYRCKEPYNYEMDVKLEVDQIEAKLFAIPSREIKGKNGNKLTFDYFLNFFPVYPSSELFSASFN